MKKSVKAFFALSLVLSALTFQSFSSTSSSQLIECWRQGALSPCTTPEGHPGFRQKCLWSHDTSQPLCGSVCTPKVRIMNPCVAVD